MPPSLCPLTPTLSHPMGEGEDEWTAWTWWEEAVSSLKSKVSSRENGHSGFCNSNLIGFGIWLHLVLVFGSIRFNLVQFGSIWFNSFGGPWRQARRMAERVNSFWAGRGNVFEQVW